MNLNKSFLSVFYHLLSEEELPIQPSETPSALPKESIDKKIEIGLLELCKKCLYINLKKIPDSEKVDFLQLKSEAISYTNVFRILNYIEREIVAKMVPEYVVKFQNLNSEKYINKEMIIDLTSLARRCLFADNNLDTENSGDNDKEFSSFLTSKIQDINETNTDEVRKALEEICNMVT